MKNCSRPIIAWPLECLLTRASWPVIALAPEGYSSKASALKGIESVRKNAPEAAVVEVE